MKSNLQGKNIVFSAGSLGLFPSEMFQSEKEMERVRKKQNKTKQNKNKKIRALMKSTYKDLLTVRS